VKITNSGARHYADSISVCCLFHTSKYVSLETVLKQLLRVLFLGGKRRSLRPCSTRDNIIFNLGVFILQTDRQNIPNSVAENNHGT